MRSKETRQRSNRVLNSEKPERQKQQLRNNLPIRLRKNLAQRGFAVEARGGAEFFFDAQELVVLGDAVGARA